MRSPFHPRICFCGGLLLLSPLGFAQEIGPATDRLSPPQVDSAINLLKANYLDASALDDAKMKRAALEGVLASLGAGAELVDTKKPAEPDFRTAVTEVLEGNLLYFRLGTLDAKNIAKLDEEVVKVGKSLAAVVLDLRDTPTSTDYELASDVAKRFVEKGKPLFQLRSPKTNQTKLFTSNSDPIFSGLVMIVTNSQTSRAAETIAASLRKSAVRAMIVGATTPGRAVEFADFGIPGADATLRVAVAAVELPGGQTLFPQGIEPDIAIQMDAAIEHDIFSRSQKAGVKKFIMDSVLPRMNEAALVSGTDPAMEEYIRRSKAEKEVEETFPRDIVLQRAVDVVTAVSVLGAKK